MRLPGISPSPNKRAFCNPLITVAPTQWNANHVFFSEHLDFTESFSFFNMVLHNTWDKSANLKNFYGVYRCGWRDVIERRNARLPRFDKLPLASSKFFSPHTKWMRQIAWIVVLKIRLPQTLDKWRDKWLCQNYGSASDSTPSNRLPKVHSCTCSPNWFYDGMIICHFIFSSSQWSWFISYFIS